MFFTPVPFYLLPPFLLFLFPPLSLSCRTKAVMALGLGRRVAWLCAGLEHVARLRVGLSRGCDCERCEAWGHAWTTMEVRIAPARKQRSAADEGEATSGLSMCAWMGGALCALNRRTVAIAVRI